MLSWDEDDYTDNNQILVSLLDPNSDIFTPGRCPCGFVSTLTAGQGAHVVYSLVSGYCSCILCAWEDQLRVCACESSHE